MLVARKRGDFERYPRAVCLSVRWGSPRPVSVGTTLYCASTITHFFVDCFVLPEQVFRFGSVRFGSVRFSRIDTVHTGGGVRVGERTIRCSISNQWKSWCATKGVGVLLWVTNERPMLGPRYVAPAMGGGVVCRIWFRPLPLMLRSGCCCWREGATLDERLRQKHQPLIDACLRLLRETRATLEEHPVGQIMVEKMVWWGEFGGSLSGAFGGFFE